MLPYSSAFLRLLLPACTAFALTPTASADVPAGRLALLTRGVNLSHWFSQVPTEGGAYRHEWFATYNRTDDLHQLAAAGFRHVRFPVEFEMFIDEERPDALREEFLPDFDRALDAMLASGLAVIVDWHAREDTKERLREDDAFVTQATLMWRAMARHLAARDPGRVFFETMNEPAGGMSLERWAAIQSGFVGAIRAEAPTHTIIISPHQWSSITELVKLPPLLDDNLVYNFHFYEPMVFTHQSAAWPGMGLEPIAQLRYPAEKTSLAENLARVGDGRGREFLLDYRADRAWLAARLQQAADWAAKHGVPLTCNEFGVFIPVTPVADRMAWLRDTRQLLEQLGIGWSMWDYAGGFGVTAKPHDENNRTLDPAVLQALGLPERLGKR